jgi:hypothetical protein
VAGKANGQFTLAYNLCHVENQKNVLPQSVQWELEVVLNDVAKKVFGHDWETAVCHQKGYLRKYLAMGDSNPEEFGDWLTKLNCYLQYFPKKLDPTTQERVDRSIKPEDELVDIQSKETQMACYNASTGALT